MNYMKGQIESTKFLQNARKKASDFTRKRLVPFTVLCYFLLSIVHECLKVAFRRFTEKTGTGIPVTEQSLSTARNKLRWEAFADLFSETVQYIYSGDIELWNGYRVWAIDGSKFALPNYPALAKLFGEEKGSPTAQASILYDVINLTVGDAAIEPLSVDERTLAERHIAALCDRLNPQNELVIFDRGYPSSDFVDFLIGKGIHFVMRVRRKFNIEIDNLPLGDNHVAVGSHILRVVKLELDDGEIESLITDITDDFDFKELYFKRWGVEKAYDVAKNALQIENFSGYTETAIRQDFFIHMLAANNLSLAYWEAQEKLEAEHKSRNTKYKYKVNLSQAISSVRDWMFATILNSDTISRDTLYSKMIADIHSAIVPIRPHRKVQRQLNNRNARFHHNRKDNL